MGESYAVRYTVKIFLHLLKFTYSERERETERERQRETERGTTCVDITDGVQELCK